ncbi:uncharacterized protein LOC134532600 isoform X2 [Bacillus rossius redtenbacheri]
MSEEKKPAKGEEGSFTISNESLQDVVRRHTGSDHISVTVSATEEVVPAGENYLSDLRRVRLTVSESGQKSKETTLIVKSFPQGEIAQGFIQEQMLFEKERQVYKEVLPDVNRLAVEALGSSPFSPEFYDTIEKDVLILEDLKATGFEMADRQAGLDLAHCRLVVEALARFHAISLAMLDRQELQTGALREVMFKESNKKLESFLRPTYSEVADAVGTWPGYERFADRLRLAGETVFRKLLGLFGAGGELVVLCHGDLWCNNMLFKYSAAGEPLEVRFVDFQVTRLASAATDLHYFLLGGPSDDVRKQGSGPLLRVYHDQLCRALRLLDCDHLVVSFSRVEQEMKDHMLYALNVACTFMQAFLAEPGPPETDSTRGMKCRLTSQRYQRALKQVLLSAEEQGVL